MGNANRKPYEIPFYKTKKMRWLDASKYIEELEENAKGKTPQQLLEISRRDDFYLPSVVNYFKNIKVIISENIVRYKLGMGCEGNLFLDLIKNLKLHNPQNVESIEIKIENENYQCDRFRMIISKDKEEIKKNKEYLILFGDEYFPLFRTCLTYIFIELKVNNEGLQDIINKKSFISAESVRIPEYIKDTIRKYPTLVNKPHIVIDALKITPYTDYVLKYPEILSEKKRICGITF